MPGHITARYETAEAPADPEALLAAQPPLAIAVALPAGLAVGIGVGLSVRRLRRGTGSLCRVAFLVVGSSLGVYEPGTAILGG